MFRCLLMMLSLYTPKSTRHHYYFNPSIVTLGISNFDPKKTEEKVSRDEYRSLRNRMITVAGKKIPFAIPLFYLRYLLALFGLAFFIFRLTLHFSGQYPFGQYGLVILLVIVLLPNLVITVVWNTISRRIFEDIEALLDQENRESYAGRGLIWKMDRNLTYMTLGFINTPQYQPPVPSLPTVTSESPLLY